jgi:exosome complex RNA-binding protein Rrp4
MRQFFKEGDVISAEVMQVNSMSAQILLQTRNLKYGKLLNGFMLKIDSNFVRRMKNHIIDFFGDRFDFKIGIIIGTNGYIWIYSPTSNQLDKSQDARAPIIKVVSREERECMSLLRNAILCLEREQLPVFKDTIELVLTQYFALKEVYGLSPNVMLNREAVKVRHESASETESEEIQISTILCEQAKTLIEKEISQNMKQFNI